MNAGQVSFIVLARLLSGFPTSNTRFDTSSKVRQPLGVHHAANFARRNRLSGQPLQDIFTRGNPLYFGTTTALPNIGLPSGYEYFPMDEKLRDEKTVATGGTIDMRTVDGHAHAGGVESIFGDAGDSSNINRTRQKIILDELLGIYRENLRLQTSNQKPLGVVVTHGTDTVAETAPLISHTMVVNDMPLTLAIVSSYATRDEDRSHADENARQAKWFVEHFPYPGAFVVGSNEVHIGAQVRKIHNKLWSGENNFHHGEDGVRQNYFASVNEFQEPLGKLIPTEVDGEYQFWVNRDVLDEYLQTPLANLDERNAALSGKLPDSFPQPAYVPHFVLGKESRYDAFQRIVEMLLTRKEPSGAVIEGDFIENSDFNLNLLVMLDDGLRKMGHHIVFVDKTNHKPALITLPDMTLQLSIPEDLFINTIPADQLRAKLAVLLSQKGADFDRADLQKNLAGEVVGPIATERTKINAPAKFMQQGEIVVAHPGCSPIDIQLAVDRLLARKVEHPILLLLGVGDGHFPIMDFSEGEARRLFPRNMSKKDITQELCERSPLIAALLDAQEKIKGLQIVIGTKVDYAKPTKVYLIGRILEKLQNAKRMDCTLQEYFERFR